MRKIFGYTKEKDSKGVRFIPEPEEAKLIRAFFRFSNDLNKLKDYVQKLNDSGVVTPRGKQWNLGLIEKYINKPIYAGLKLVDGEYVRDENVKTPLINNDVWSQYIERKKKNSDLVCKAGSTRGKLLSGLLKCGKCGANLSYNNNHGSARYHCSHKHCPVAINADNIEHFLLPFCLLSLVVESKRSRNKKLRPNCIIADVEKASDAHLRDALRLVFNSVHIFSGSIKLTLFDDDEIVIDRTMKGKGGGKLLPELAIKHAEGFFIYVYDDDRRDVFFDNEYLSLEYVPLLLKILEDDASISRGKINQMQTVDVMEDIFELLQLASAGEDYIFDELEKKKKRLFF